MQRLVRNGKCGGGEKGRKEEEYGRNTDKQKKRKGRVIVGVRVKGRLMDTRKQTDRKTKIKVRQTDRHADTTRHEKRGRDDINERIFTGVVTFNCYGNIIYHNRDSLFLWRLSPRRLQ